MEAGDREGHVPNRVRRIIEKKKEQPVSEPKRKLHRQIFLQKSFGINMCIRNAQVQRTLLETACIPVQSAVLQSATIKDRSTQRHAAYTQSPGSEDYEAIFVPSLGQCLLFTQRRK